MRFFAARVVTSKRSTVLPLLLSLLGGLAGSAVHAEDSKPIHWSGKKQLWDRKNDKVELIGFAAVHQPGESLWAERILLDLKNRTLEAYGNCVYVASDVVIRAEEMRIHLDHRTGSVIAGRILADRFTFSGKRINRLGLKKFQAQEGEYTTCIDCPASWSFTGEDVSMELEGYAHMKNVNLKVKDAPVLWLPYLIVPVKTKRQTGFLFPKFSLSTLDGFTYIQPFFWAINEWSDMTFSAGYMTKRGTRAEWEGRYVLANRSRATANYYYLHDRQFPVRPNRWGLRVEQTQELPFGFEQKMKIIDASDSLYPTQIKDVPKPSDADYGGAVLTSDLILSNSNSAVSSYVAVKRHRNLISLDPDPSKVDPKTVQVLPTGVMTTNDRAIFGGDFGGGMTVGLTRFTRSDGAFDRDLKNPPASPNDPIRLGIDPIREATRFSLTPSIYSAFRPADVISVVPSAQYQSYFYNFGNTVPDLARGYLLLQTEVSTQFERVYETDDPEVPRVKHLYRPFLTYSMIPLVNESSRHPFLRQIEYAQDTYSSGGYNFDNYDIVPLGNSPSLTNYFVPLGHSIQYGLTTQLIRKLIDYEGANAKYKPAVELNLRQAYNIKEIRNSDPKPLTRFFADLSTQFNKFSSMTEYTHDPYVENPHRLSTSATWSFVDTIHQQILEFKRSVSLGYTWAEADGTENLRAGMTYSINDYIMPSATTSFDLTSHRFLYTLAALQFQSPSRCWRFTLQYETDLRENKVFSFDISLNLTGSGYGGFYEATTKAAKQ